MNDPTHTQSEKLRGLTITEAAYGALAKARDFIETEDQWAKGANALRPDGSMVTDIEQLYDPNEEFACYCLNGAILRAASEMFGSPYDSGGWAFPSWTSPQREVINEARSMVSHSITNSGYADYAGRISSITGFNDDPDTTHTDVLNILDETIGDYNNMEVTND